MTTARYPSGSIAAERRRDEAHDHHHGRCEGPGACHICDRIVSRLEDSVASRRLAEEEDYRSEHAADTTTERT
jgi:ferredoxin